MGWFDQGSVERTNRDIEDMLITCLKSNSTTHWGDGLRFIQVIKNRAYQEDIKCSPYEAMFGQPNECWIENIKSS